MVKSRSVILSTLAAIALAFNGCVTATSPNPLLVQLIKAVLGCIPEGTSIDTPDGGRPIEEIKPGDIVFGFSGEPVRVLQKDSYNEDPSPKRFYRIEFDNGSVVSLSDMHRIDGVRAKNLCLGMEVNGSKVISIRAFGGVERSYDLRTEDSGYQIEGIPVNTMMDELKRAAGNRGP